MTTEQDFQRGLTRNPKNYLLRTIFADWLQDHGDPRAEGYRALGVLKRCPHHYKSFHEWTWWGTSDQIFVFGHADALEEKWSALIEDGLPSSDEFEKNFATRRKAEDAAALAWSKLPKETQERILKKTLAKTN